MEEELKAAEAALEAAYKAQDEEQIILCQNRVAGLRNAMSLSEGGVATKSKKK